jgi:copper transport protein
MAHAVAGNLSATMEPPASNDVAMAKDSSMSPMHGMAMEHAKSPGAAMSPGPDGAPRAVPGRSSFTLHLDGGGAKGQATVAPKPDGHARVTLALMRDDGTALQAKEVSVTFSMAQMGIEGIARPAHRADHGNSADTWVVDDVPLLVSGNWTIKVDALVSDFDSISLRGQGDVGLEQPPPR